MTPGKVCRPCCAVFEVWSVHFCGPKKELQLPTAEKLQKKLPESAPESARQAETTGGRQGGYGTRAMTARQHDVRAQGNWRAPTASTDRRAESKQQLVPGEPGSASQVTFPFLSPGPYW
jgi:hypothetical protein